MKINPAIFGMYDIRGIFGQDLTVENVKLLGRALGTFFLQNKIKEVAVGHDNRLSGPTVKKTLFQGLNETGINIIDLGLIMTPMIYFSWRLLGANATIMITASHNPPEYNGFKVSLDKQPIHGDCYQEIRRILQSGKFLEGKGGVKKFNLWPKYLKKITQDIKLKKRLEVVVDSGNGTTAPFVQEFFAKLDCSMIGLYIDSDGSFPNHPPYPQKIEFYSKLMSTIKQKKADLGLAFDGDGDRVGIFNEKGEFISNDILAILFIREILKKNPGAKIVMNISTSLAVIDDIKKRGGKLILWKTGYPFITSKMKEIAAIFGGEISGHFFFADRYYGFDDAFYATARLLEILASTDKPLSVLLADIPKFYTTPEFRIEVPDELNNNKFTIIKKIALEIKREYPEAEILDFDGVRFNFEDSWGLIRASNTQPMLTGRAEAKTQAKLEEIKKIIKNKLAKNKIALDWEHSFGE